MNGVPLVVFSVAYFVCISYSVISLYSYGISKDVERVEESFSPILTPIDDGNFMDDGNPVTQGVRTDAQTDSLCESVAVDNYSLIITSSLEHWIASGHYREHNLTLSIVARQMGVPQRQLQEWLRQSEYGKLAVLVTTLRIEEAKRILKQHSDWSLETVANYCGFSSREYFHRTFRQITGTTPYKF
jgi:AraC-like DNA-binding protein